MDADAQVAGEFLIYFSTAPQQTLFSPGGGSFFPSVYELFCEIKMGVEIIRIFWERKIIEEPPVIAVLFLQSEIQPHQIPKLEWKGVSCIGFSFHRLSFLRVEPVSGF